MSEDEEQLARDRCVARVKSHAMMNMLATEVVDKVAPFVKTISVSIKSFRPTERTIQVKSLQRIGYGHTISIDNGCLYLESKRFDLDITYGKQEYMLSDPNSIDMLIRDIIRPTDDN